MEYVEFHDLVESTIHGMYDRIPAEYHEDFDSLFIGGELEIAVDTLVVGLARLNLPITPTERDKLTVILQEMNQPESRLDSLNVIAPGDQTKSTP
jgi:hypothetical protein